MIFNFFNCLHISRQVTKKQPATMKRFPLPAISLLKIIFGLLIVAILILVYFHSRVLSVADIFGHRVGRTQMHPSQRSASPHGGGSNSGALFSWTWSGEKDGGVLKKYFSTKRMCGRSSCTEWHREARIIHQTWKTLELPDRLAGWASSWRRCFPTWKYVLWSDEANAAFVQEHYPWFYEIYSGFAEGIMRADAIRYMYMHQYGGIYTDLDSVCLHPFEGFLEGYGIVFSEMHITPDPKFPVYMQNNFIYSVPKHPFWLDLLRAIVAQGRREGKVEEIAGPDIMIRVLEERAAVYTDVKIYPPEYFNPFSWWTGDAHCRAYNAMEDEELRRCIAFYNSSYVIQLHAHSW